MPGALVPGIEAADPMIAARSASPSCPCVAGPRRNEREKKLNHDSGVQWSEEPQNLLP